MLVETGPHQRPLIALAEILIAMDTTASGTPREDMEAMVAVQEALPHTLGKPPSGLKITQFGTKIPRFPAEHASRCKAGLPQKKRVLMVVDVQDGYDASFIAGLPANSPGSLAYISSLHSVSASYELASRQLIERHPKGKKMVRLDKRWNRGLEEANFARVAARVVRELRDGTYDCAVFTHDYLEKRNGEEKGVFALDDTPWADPTKPVAMVPYGDYVTFDAGGLGTDISERIRAELPEVTNARGPCGTVNGVPALYFRKQADDAFDDRREESARTRHQPWLDDVDVDDNGRPQPNAQTLLEKLVARDLGPDEAELVFCGVVTDRCVASSLLHAVEHGYQTALLEGGCCSVDETRHTKGVAMIRDKAGACVDVVP